MHRINNTPEFDLFSHIFENLYAKIKNETPFAMSFPGDFNAHSQNWWPEVDTNAEGVAIYDVS